MISEADVHRYFWAVALAHAQLPPTANGPNAIASSSSSIVTAPPTADGHAGSMTASKGKDKGKGKGKSKVTAAQANEGGPSVGPSSRAAHADDEPLRSTGGSNTKKEKVQGKIGSVSGDAYRADGRNERHLEKRKSKKGRDGGEGLASTEAAGTGAGPGELEGKKQKKHKHKKDKDKSTEDGPKKKRRKLKASTPTPWEQERMDEEEIDELLPSSPVLPASPVFPDPDPAPGAGNQRDPCTTSQATPTPTPVSRVGRGRTLVDLSDRHLASSARPAPAALPHSRDQDSTRGSESGKQRRKRDSSTFEAPALPPAALAPTLPPPLVSNANANGDRTNERQQPRLHAIPPHLASDVRPTQRLTPMGETGEEGQGKSRWPTWATSTPDFLKRRPKARGIQ